MQRHRALSNEDRLELNRIFVGASLPHDHPHSIKLTIQKPDLFDAIIRSPTLARKIRRQFSKTSLARYKRSRALRRCRSMQLDHWPGHHKKVRIPRHVVDDHLASSGSYDTDAQQFDSLTSHAHARPVSPPTTPTRRQGIPDFNSPSPHGKREPCPTSRGEDWAWLQEPSHFVWRSSSAPCLFKQKPEVSVLMLPLEEDLQKRAVSANMVNPDPYTLERLALAKPISAEWPTATHAAADTNGDT